MKVNIIKPDNVIFNGEASLVQLPGTNGSFELMENHAAVIATLAPGTVRVVAEGGEQQFTIRAGVLKMANNEALILVQ